MLNLIYLIMFDFFIIKSNNIFFRNKLVKFSINIYYPVEGKNVI